MKGISFGEWAELIKELHRLNQKDEAGFAFGGIVRLNCHIRAFLKVSLMLKIASVVLKDLPGSVKISMLSSPTQNKTPSYLIIQISHFLF